MSDESQHTNSLPGMIMGGILFGVLIGIGFLLPVVIAANMSDEWGSQSPHPVVEPINPKLINPEPTL